MQYKAVAAIVIQRADFRPKQRKQASGTEVGKGRGEKLPSQTPKTGLKDGSQRLRWKVKERSPHRGADSYAIIKTVSLRK